jgi:cellulose synthase/poly-beta-1,6-N-acetylglucosamine synthase-like glycosyltransferase
LLPVYREAKILPELVKSINLLDYPPELLDIKLLLEADDEETLAVARKLTLKSNWEVLIVPDIGPRTKPKALNVGLARARGSFVTIYDAEDRPDPAQLRAAVSAFANDDGKMACVQAPLGYYNAEQNWITKQFSLEYDAQFKVILPALVRLGIAFPLGGTSNHFRGLM